MTETLTTTVVGALSAVFGVLAGGVFTKWAQDRHWLRDQELAAYRDVLAHYARFAMEINRAHRDRRGWDYDWGGWSAALLHAGLLASAEAQVVLVNAMRRSLGRREDLTFGLGGTPL